MPRTTTDVVLSTVLSAFHEGVLVWAVPSGELLTCNDAASQILGVPRSELEGRNLDYPWQLAHEDGTPVPKAERGAVKAVSSGQATAGAVYRVGRPDGSWAWVRSSSVMVRDATDTPYAVITTFIDITELRQAREEKASLASRLAEAMAGANVGTWENNLETGYVERNSRWAEILGHAPSEIEPTFAAFIDRIHPDDRPACSAIMEAGFGRGEPFVVECRSKHRDGHWHWVQVRGKVVERTADGHSRRVAGVLIDVDARKRMEETLRATLAENERLVADLQAALLNIRTLEGLLPICMYCKGIRDDVGAWSSIEAYVSRRTNVAFSHSICPPCLAKHIDEM
jgi:PAS domain S-box-containing protein